MKTAWRLGLVGAVAFTVFVLITAPAAKLLPWLQPYFPAVQISGISGSLWSGQAQTLRAQQVQVQVQVQVQDVQWHLRPLALFGGALEVALNGRFQGQPVQAQAGTGLFSGPYLKDVQGRISAADLLFLSGKSLAELDGLVEFDIDRITGFDQRLPAVAGRIAWSPARILTPLQLNLGKAEAHTQIDGGVTRGQLSANGGALTLTGELTLEPDGRYQLAGDVQKRGGVPQAVDKFLETFAEFNNGSYRLEWSDQVKF